MLHNQMERIWMIVMITLVLFVFVKPSFDVGATEFDYKPCHIAKGQATLYNCGRKFTQNGDNIAHLNNISTPMRYG